MSDQDLIRLSDAIAALTGTICFSPHAYGSDEGKIWLDGASVGMQSALDALRACQTVQVGVKPLEFVEIREGQYFESRVIGILYSVRLGSDGVVRWQAGHMGTWHESTTLEAAKAAAQADYDARILSSLTVQPSPDVAALVEALDKTTAHGQRIDYSRVGHSLSDASWHVHLAGFRSQDDAEAFLSAALARLKGGAA